MSGRKTRSGKVYGNTATESVDCLSKGKKIKRKLSKSRKVKTNPAKGKRIKRKLSKGKKVKRHKVDKEVDEDKKEVENEKVVEDKKVIDDEKKEVDKKVVENKKEVDDGRAVEVKKVIDDGKKVEDEKIVDNEKVVEAKKIVEVEKTVEDEKVKNTDDAVSGENKVSEENLVDNKIETAVSKSRHEFKIDDGTVMYFRSNLEWLAAGTITFDRTKVVYMKGMCNMIPSAYPKLRPLFPAATRLILDNVEMNHLYYWAQPKYFPAVEIIYLNSDPCNPVWFFSWSTNVEIRYIRKQDQPYPADKILKLFNETRQYYKHGERRDMLPSLVAITREEFVKAIDEVCCL